MKTLELSRTVAAISGRPFDTMRDYVKELQGGGRITRGTRGKNGGAEMTAADRVNLLLSSVLDFPRGEPLCDSLARVRSLELRIVRRTKGLDDNIEQGVRGAFEYIKGLSIGPLDDLGEALDSIVRDMQSGAFQKWAAGDTISITVEFSQRNLAALLVIDRPSHGAYFAFGVDDDFKPAPTGLERIVRLHREAFERLAKGDT